MTWRSALVVALLFSGCDATVGTDDGGGGTDAGPGLTGPHVTIGWQMRCVEGVCPPADPPARSLDHTHGQDGAEVLCDLQFDGTTRRMDLTVRSQMGAGYGIEVRGAQVALMGGALMGSYCQMRVFEPDDVDLLAPCGSNNPTMDRACQITRVDIRDIDAVPTLLGQFRCESAAEERSPTHLRDVTSPTSASGNGMFTFTGCAGL